VTRFCCVSGIEVSGSETKGDAAFFLHLIVDEEICRALSCFRRKGCLALPTVHISAASV
jgi:hypothetical protein